jgi:hypothetical protein
MPTPYSSVYDIFLSLFDDITFITVDSDDSLKKRYLQNSIPKFRRCLQDLTNRDDVNNTFNITLSDEEQLILGNLMVIEYLNPKIVSSKLIQQSMTSREFEMTSQANHLRQLQELKTDKQKEVSKLIVDYTYNNSDLSRLK